MKLLGVLHLKTLEGFDDRLVLHLHTDAALLLAVRTIDLAGILAFHKPI